MIFIDKNASRKEQFYKLIERCYDDYCFFNQFDMEKRKQFVTERMSEIGENELVIPYLPLYLTTKCSLNCEKCNNLMPMFHGKAYDFSWEKTRNSLDYILDNVKEMIFCELVGGEPFLNSEFENILDYVMHEKKIRQIVVVTNGTVIPSDSVLCKLRESKALVRVSDYGLFEKMSQFVAKLDSASINVRIQQDMKWNDPGNTLKRGKNTDELKRQYNRCEFSMKCKYLCENQLFTCARAASLYKLGITDAEGDVMTISANTTKQELLDFYLHDYGAVCDYCDLWSDYGGDEIPAAVQVGGKTMPHSRYTIISNYELNCYKQKANKFDQVSKQNVDDIGQSYER